MSNLERRRTSNVLNSIVYKISFTVHIKSFVEGLWITEFSVEVKFGWVQFWWGVPSLVGTNFGGWRNFGGPNLTRPNQTQYPNYPDLTLPDLT